jgi:hypothetical protein
MTAEEADRLRPFSAVEGTYPPNEWPLDVQRVDENGIDLEQIKYQLSLTPAERLRRLEAFAEFILTARQRNGVAECSDIVRS